MDRWKARELKQMELGGNKLARAFYEKNGMISQGSPPDHKNPALSKYKADLKARSEQALGQTPSAAPVTQATSQQHNNTEPRKIEEQKKPEGKIIMMGGSKSNLSQKIDSD